MGCGKRALCRKQQASPIALVRCNSPSKECSRPSLSSQPSSLPKHSKNVGKEEEVSTKDPQEFPHSGGRVIHATKASLKKRGVRPYPLVAIQSSKTWAMYSVSCCEFYSQVPSTWKPEKTREITETCQLMWAHSLAEWAWCTQECTCRKQRPLVSIHNCGKNKMAVSRYPVPCLKNSLYKSQTRQS